MIDFIVLCVDKVSVNRKARNGANSRIAAAQAIIHRALAQAKIHRALAQAVIH